jgi:hypothetical protein
MERLDAHYPLVVKGRIKGRQKRRKIKVGQKRRKIKVGQKRKAENKSTHLHNAV